MPDLGSIDVEKINGRIDKLEKRVDKIVDALKKQFGPQFDCEPDE